MYRCLGLFGGWVGGPGVVVGGGWGRLLNGRRRVLGWLETGRASPSASGRRSPPARARPRIRGLATGSVAGGLEVDGRVAVPGGAPAPSAAVSGGVSGLYCGSGATGKGSGAVPASPAGASGRASKAAPSAVSSSGCSGTITGRPNRDSITDRMSGIRAPPPISTIASGVRPDLPTTSPVRCAEVSTGPAISASKVSWESSSRPPSPGTHTAPLVDSRSLGVPTLGVERRLCGRVGGACETVLFEVVVADQPVDVVAADPVAACGAEDHPGGAVDDGDCDAGTAQVVEHQRGVVREHAGHPERPERGGHFGHQQVVAELLPGQRGPHGTGLRPVLVGDADGRHRSGVRALGEQRADGFGGQFLGPTAGRAHGLRPEDGAADASGGRARQTHRAGTDRDTENRTHGMRL